ncbi:hypothetical protein DMJ13_20865 [halophilic archaeon]|nr:hypothetical protein DMJ13_20865 [halophilic archaeon]
MRSLFSTFFLSAREVPTTPITSVCSTYSSLSTVVLFVWYALATNPKPDLHQMKRETSDLELTSALAAVCGIYEAEFRVYLAVLDHPGATSGEIADVVARDQSTTSKRLKSLHEQGLVTRYLRPMDDGGVKYLYEAQPFAETVAWLDREISEWTDAVLTQFSHLQTK